MNKHIALVLGIIFSITFLFVPFTGAYASSDTSVALPQFVFSLMFSNITIGSLIDVTNYNAATGTSSSDNYVHLPNSVGSYSQINRQGINVAQNLLCLRFTIDNPSSSFFDDIVIEPYINGSPAHLYGTYTQSDNNNSISYYMFFYIGADTVRVKDSQGQDITPWGIRITRTNTVSYAWSYSSSSTSLFYYNYTLQSQTVDPGEAAELALDIINVLQLSQLSDNLGMINTQLDTGNIASMMASMLTYLANIPNIIQYIDQIETLDNNILSAIQTFNSFYNSQFDSINYIAPSSYYRYDSEFNLVTGNYSNNEWYIYIPYSTNIDGDFYIKLLTYRNYGDMELSVAFTYNYGENSTTWFEPYWYNTAYDIYKYIYISFHKDKVDISPPSYICIHLVSDSGISIFNQSSVGYIGWSQVPKNTNIFVRIWYTLNQLLGYNSNVPSNIETTTNDINQNATTVNDFQSNTQQSLDQNLNNVPVADYQIQATTGTQYMKAYSEALFNASNGFRIWYMLPLILFVIGMLIRWGIKK